MLELTFYKKVPFDKENENVLVCSKADHDAFLTQFQVNTNLISIEKFFFNGTDENAFLVVSLDELPFDVNYLKVVQTLSNSETVKERVLFFFVNNFVQLAENSIQINLTIDKWNSWFENQSGTEVVRPDLKNLIINQGHFAGEEEHESLIVPDKSTQNFDFIPAAGDFAVTKYRVIFHATARTFGEVVFASTDSFTLTEAIVAAGDIEQLKTFVCRSGDLEGTQQFEYQIYNAYIVPEIIYQNMQTNLIFVFTKLDSTKIWFYCLSYYVLNLNGSTFKRVHTDAIKTYQQKCFDGEIRSFGTLSNQIEIPNNGKMFNFKTQISCSNDISILLSGNGQIIDITKDFEWSITYSEYSNYVAQNKLSIEAGNISKFINTGFALLSAGTNFGLGGVQTLTSNIAGFLTERARINDLQRMPYKLGTATSSLANITLFEGLATFIWTAENADDILSSNEYFGFKFNRFESNLDISQHAATDRFKYIRCNQISIVGDFNFDVRQYLEYLFKRGVRIWYNKDHFLDSLNQKIEQTE